jgi:MoaA/NifB/PqqE/SkfB family radical SAM enzyme
MTVTHLQLEPTTRCNFTCGFCCGRKMPQTDMAAETFASVLADFPSLTQLELQGEGESLIHPRFFEMVRAARARGIRVSLISNGSFFSAAHVEQILETGIEKISVSIESADAETFRQIRGGKFDKVVRGIQLLLTRRRALGVARPVVGLAVTVLRRTRGELGGILALYQELGLDGGITMQPLQGMSAYADCYDAEMQAQALTRDEVDRMWVDFRSSPVIRRIQKQRRSHDGFHDDLMKDWRPARRRCPWLDRGLYVNRDGMATACCMIKDERFALGRIGVDGADTIIAARDQLRAELAAGRIPEPCSGCELARFSVMSKLGLIRYAALGLKKRLTRESVPADRSITG